MQSTYTYKTFYYSIAKATPRVSLTCLKVEKIVSENFDFALLPSCFLLLFTNP